MSKLQVEVNGTTYNVTVARTEEARAKGLQGVTQLAPDEGMLFVFDDPQPVSFWMSDTEIPLDIIYIDAYGEVTQVNQGQPMSHEMFEGEGVKYVLEVNSGSGISMGDDVEGLPDQQDDDFEYPSDNPEDPEAQAEGGDIEGPKMVVLGPKGKPQMELKGGERIFSRPNTKTLIRLSKRAYKSKDEKDYRALGKKVFQYLHTQDHKADDYVELPDK